MANKLYNHENNFFVKVVAEDVTKGYGNLGVRIFTESGGFVSKHFDFFGDKSDRKELDKAWKFTGMLYDAVANMEASLENIEMTGYDKAMLNEEEKPKKKAAIKPKKVKKDA